MKLASKGLMVVSVPLIFQLIIVAVLAVLLWHAQELASKQARARDIISECNRLSVNIAGAMQSAFGHAGSTAPPLKRSDLDFIQSSVQALAVKVADQPEEAKNVERLTQFTEKFIRQLTTLKEVDQTANKIRSQARDFLKLRVYITFDHLYKIFEDMIAIENQTHPEQPQKREQARLMIRAWLIASVAISSLIALALAYFSSITIRKPLEKMVKNAVSISRRQPLDPVSAGNDELAHLDRVLHSVNAAIDEALTKEQNLISYAADLVFSIDSNGIFLRVNPYSQTMLRSAAENLIGKSVLSVIANDEQDRAKQLIGNHYHDRETFSFEIRMQPKDRDAIDTVWSVIWSQRESSFFCVAHDVTEQKHVERLKQDFIAMLSHDLRTPLMSVLSSINLVQSGAAGNISGPINSELSHAEQSVDHLIELVNDLLDFDKLEAGRMVFEILPIRISELLDKSLRLVQALADRNQVVIELPTNDFMVAGDQNKLIQVVVNLLSNALKHSPKGGLVKIQTRTTDNMLEISIHDQGPGVPDQFAEKIFAPFEQISHRPTAALGTGLGLTICKLIVEGHGGKIGVRNSTFLQGSAFWLTVPTAASNLERQVD